MENQSQPDDKYSKAIEPVVIRMDQAKWDVARSVTLSGAGLSTAIVFLITQIGVAACSLQISLFCASLAIPTWLALWRVGEAYSFFGPESHSHFSTPRGSGVGLILFAFGGVLLLISFVSLIWHFSVLSAVAFLIGCIGMVFLVFKHQADVQAWVGRDRADEISASPEF